MKTFITAIGLFLIVLAGLGQKVPQTHQNLGYDNMGVYLIKNGNKIYASTANDKFQFTDLYGNPQGNQQGISLNFKFPELNGTLYYGFINYNDSKYPQPVYFKRYSKIDSGKAYINIRKNLSGKYDMVGWEKRGFGTLGYRIIRSDGQMLYDGKISFAFDGAKFLPLPTLVEGPFVDMVDQSSAVISFETTKPVQAGVIVDKKTFGEEEPSRHHEIKVQGLFPATSYQYTVKYGELNVTHTFKTAPEKGSRKPFTFAYASDSRAGRGGGERNLFGTNAYIVKKIGAVAAAEKVAFMQFSGDLVNGYENSRERMQLEYANWKHAIEPFAHHFPVYEAFGNHESFGLKFYDAVEKQSYMVDYFPFDGQSGEDLFIENFVNPVSDLESEDGSDYDPNPKTQDFPTYKETVFWYQYDNVAVVVLNSNYWYAPANHEYTSGNLHAYIMDNQLEWLKRTILQLEKEKTIDHVFVTLHTPFFPNGGHVDDDMWYGGSNAPRPVVAGKKYNHGIIERRDQLLDILINQAKKPVAILTGDEHNYNLLPITDDMNRYPDEYKPDKITLKRKFYQINNGAAGAPYYAREETPWMEHVEGFSTQNAIVLVDVDGESVNVRVKNPDTLEEITAYKLR
jgi:hypothetical protein